MLRPELEIRRCLDRYPFGYRGLKQTVTPRSGGTPCPPQPSQPRPRWRRKSRHQPPPSARVGVEPIGGRRLWCLGRLRFCYERCRASGAKPSPTWTRAPAAAGPSGLHTPHTIIPMRPPKIKIKFEPRPAGRPAASLDGVIGVLSSPVLIGFVL